MKHPLARIGFLALACAGVAFGQPAPIVRGDVASIAGNVLRLTSASGEKTTIRLPDDVRVNLRVPATLDDIKQKTYLGATSTPGPNGTLIASEVHIFPDGRRGTGEGHNPMESMPGMDHSSGSGGMAGMMDDAGMEMLSKASGKAFDTAFLTMMVEHHEGAVEMARTEQQKGGYQPAKDMAGDIVTGQTAEIAEMKELLAKKS